jgi:hypothetical protein
MSLGLSLALSRHPELVSGSMPPHGAAAACEARWMLKQVQHDEEMGAA